MRLLAHSSASCLCRSSDRLFYGSGHRESQTPVREHRRFTVFTEAGDTVTQDDS